MRTTARRAKLARSTFNGEPFDVFPVNDRWPSHTGTRDPLQKRDRLSKAILNQVSAEYRGEFIDDRLTVNVGLRAAVLHARPEQLLLHQLGVRLCRVLGQNATLNAIFAANNPYVVDPVTGRVISGWSPRSIAYSSMTISCPTSA